MEVEGEGATTLRIFVGGLGESVTAEDLSKTFSSLGLIKEVEIVRTSGRSFAYMDFQPSSYKALAKLFSTYNGCIWKGGRLRLEKAKEHYLVRLRREWKEEAELAKAAELVKEVPKEEAAEKKVDHSKKLKSLTEETMQLKIFFPGLRKVKSLPYRGSGKHKYSFQRVEVPPLPIHFCDCEEHCNPIETTKKENVNAVETQPEKEEEEELNIMRTVLDKILKRGNESGAGSNETELAPEGEPFDKANEDLQVDDDDASDDLVINMVNGESEILNLMRSESQGRTSAHKESKFRKHEFSEEARVMNKLKTPKRNNHEAFDSSDTISSKKARLLPGLENKRTPTAAKKKGISDTHPVELVVAENSQPPEQKESIQQSKGGLSWLQKSSWKKMVGETSDKSFSLSQIISDSAAKSSNSDDMGTENPTVSKRQKKLKISKSKSVVEVGMKDLGLGKEGPPEDNNVTSSLFSVISPSKIVSVDSEGPREGKPTSPETYIHQSISKSSADGSKDLELEKEEIPQEKISIITSSAEVPPENTSGISVAPKEAEIADQKTNKDQIARGSSWLQKSSWRELVAEANGTPFSLSQIFYGSNSPNSTSISKQNNLSERNESGSGKAFEISEDGNKKDRVKELSTVANQGREDGVLPAADGEFNLQRKNSEKEKEDGSSFSMPSESKISLEPNKIAKRNVSSGEIGPFVRTAASVKEWAKLRKDLKGPLKKRNNS